MKYESTNAYKELNEDYKEKIIRKSAIQERIDAISTQIENIEEIERIDDETILNFIKLKEKHIDSLESEINQIKFHKPKISSLRYIYKTLKNIEKDISNYQNFNVYLTQKVTELNAQGFYDALLKLEEMSTNTCPACDTDLSRVARDPFKKAKEELGKLKDIQEKMKEKNLVERKIMNEHFPFIQRIINDYQENVELFPLLLDEHLSSAVMRMSENFEQGSAQKTPISLPDKVLIIHKFIEICKLRKTNIKNYIKGLKATVSKIEASQELIKEKNEEIKRINEEIIHIKNLHDQFNNENSSKLQLEKQLVKYEKREKELAKSIEKEKSYNIFVEQVQQSYKAFYNDLLAYKLAVEKDNIIGIEEQILNYYQKINKDDGIDEFITKVIFKVHNNNYQIHLLKYNNEREFDAFSCLSEGHLRGLGLSIMLAIAEKNKAPFLIFDDVVNAIDSDHRSNIIELMYTHSYLNKTQLIVTTHDRLFWERFCNFYKEIDRIRVNQLSFILNYTNLGTVCLQYNIGFEEKIEEALERFDIRQALVYCRIWFETLVVNYCKKEKIKLMGRFSKGTNNNTLQPILEQMYDVLPSQCESVKVLKKDLINWRGQNQEHHAFDELSFNFVHSKNSSEVRDIFEAVKLLSFELNTSEEKVKKEKELINLLSVIEQRKKQLENENFAKYANEEAVKKARLDKSTAEKRVAILENDISLLNLLEEKLTPEAN